MQKIVFPPGGFTLPATNGYKLSVIAIDRKQLLVAAIRGQSAGVVYVVPATRTNPLKGFNADLGDLLKIDVDFHQTGKKRFNPGCGSGQKPRYRKGFYEGTIEFHGETGYADAQASSAKAIPFSGSGGGCTSFGAIFGDGARGAELVARGVDNTVVKALKARHGAPVGFVVRTFERSGPIEINRFLDVQEPPESFTFDASLDKAAITPPLPFHGSAQYQRTSRKTGSWLGDLTIDLPGRSGVPLAGTDFNAKLLPLVDFSGSLFAARQLARG